MFLLPDTGGGAAPKLSELDANVPTPGLGDLCRTLHGKVRIDVEE